MEHTQKTHADRPFGMDSVGKDVQLLRSENRAVSCQVCATHRFSVVSALQEKVGWSKLTGGHRESRTRHCGRQVGVKRLRTLIHGVPAGVVEVEEVALLVPAEEWRAELHHG